MRSPSVTYRREFHWLRTAALLRAPVPLAHAAKRRGATRGFAARASCRAFLSGHRSVAYVFIRETLHCGERRVSVEGLRQVIKAGSKIIECGMAKVSHDRDRGFA